MIDWSKNGIMIDRWWKKKKRTLATSCFKVSFNSKLTPASPSISVVFPGNNVSFFFVMSTFYIMSIFESTQHFCYCNIIQQFNNWTKFHLKLRKNKTIPVLRMSAFDPSRKKETLRRDMRTPRRRSWIQTLPGYPVFIMSR